MNAINIVYDLDDSKFNGEGRTITIEFPKFYLVACYVPNSGDGLKRLDFRVNEWYGLLFYYNFFFFKYMN